MLDIRTHYVIVEGEATYEHYREYTSQGYVILYTARARQFHPGAGEDDTIMFIAKPISNQEWTAYVNYSSASDTNV